MKEFDTKDGFQWNSWLAVVILFLVWLIPSLGYIQKFTGSVGLFVLPLMAFLVIATLAIVWNAKRDDIPRVSLFALFAVGLVLFAVLYPVANSGVLGPGSDRDDALNVAIEALISGNYPYGVTTYLGNPPTPMPGALILAVPFFLIGNSAFQNIFWLLAITVWCGLRFKRADIASLWLAIVFLGCPASLSDFVTGGDYFINAIYVAIATATILATINSRFNWHRFAAYVFLAFAISSRPVYVVVPIILAGSIYQSLGLRRMMEFLVVVSIVCFALNVPFFLYDPQLFPVTRLSEKLASIPSWIFPSIVLPALGIAIAGLSFVVRPANGKIFGLIAGALAVMFYPPFVYELASGPPGATAFWTASYSLPVTVFAGLWLFDRAETQTDRSLAMGLGQ